MTEQTNNTQARIFKIGTTTFTDWGASPPPPLSAAAGSRDFHPANFSFGAQSTNIETYTNIWSRPSAS